MIDRLISGAGAFSHLADRVVRVIARGGSLAHQPGGLLLAALLGIGALVAVVLGVESGGDRTPRTLTAAELADGDHGDRLFATVSGGLAPFFVETFRDENDDGQQQPDERVVAWNYFLIDPASRSGVTVTSDRPPSAIYTYETSGVVVEDATYVTEDLGFFKEELAGFGLTLDPTRYLDTTGAVPTGAPHDLADPLPSPGTAVSVSSSRGIAYVTVCSADANGDGVCGDDEVDLYDLYIYDEVSKRAITVLTTVSPEFAPTSFSGVVRRAPKSVEDAVTTDGVALDDFGVRVSATYLLTDGDTPADPGPLFALAAVAAALAAIIVVGVAGGYLRFRPGGATPPASATMVSGDRIALRITGILRASDGLIHVRDAAGALVRFALAPGSDGASTLIVERNDRHEGVAVGRGELTAMQVGTVRPLRGDRPALRLSAATGPILVAFDTVDARDRAAAELAMELATEPVTEPAMEQTTGLANETDPRGDAV